MTVSRATCLLALFVLVGCGGSGAASSSATAAPPVETRPPNGAGQAPAFAGQTRAPEMKAGVAYQTTVVAEGLEYPWAIAFLPDRRMLVTERVGRLRIVDAAGKLSAPVAGLPAVDARDQGGLLGLAIDPAFAKTRLIYWSYAERNGDVTNTAVARGRLAADGRRVEDVEVIFRQTPAMDSAKHYGSRLVFGRDGTLFVTLGERSILEGRRQAERLDGTLGKVVRINPDGSIPADNPFVKSAGARPEIWSIGHRNIQAAALNPATGRLWTVEHGARGGDEINIPAAGKDYGWPTITYGIEYAGGPVGAGITRKAGLEQPVYYWDPVIAPSGAQWYDGAAFPAWRGSLFVGALKEMRLVRLTVANGRVTGEEHLLTDRGHRIRDVRQGPDGALYLVTDDANGELWRVAPRR